MPNSILRQGILGTLLDEAAIPYDSISVVDINANPPVVNIQYKPSATQEQINLGNQIKDAFDWRRRRALARATVVSTLGSLTAGQRAIVDAHQRAEYLRNNPALAAALGVAIGVPIVVDEVDPT